MLPRRHRLLLVLLSILIGIHVLVPRTESQGSSYSVLLNGTSSYVDVPYNANLNITGALTMEAWVKTTSTAYQMVLERGDWWQDQISLYAIAVERMTGKRTPLPDLSGQWPAIDRTMTTDADPDER